MSLVLVVKGLTVAVEKHFSLPSEASESLMVIKPMICNVTYYCTEKSKRINYRKKF